MAAGQIFKFVIKGGKQFMGTNSKSIADDLVKQGGKRVPKNKVPDGANVKKAPSTPNPRSSKGTYTRPQPPAARPKTTAPARPKAPAKAPSKPSTQTTAPARPKPKTKAPAMPTSGSRYTGGRGKGRGKPPLMPKSMVRERPNIPPKPKGSAPALLRDSVRPEAPEIDKDSIRDTTKKGPETRRAPSKKTDTVNPGPSKRGKPSKKTDTVNPGPSKRGKPTKTKKMSPGSSPKPKLRPDTKKTNKRSTSPKPKLDPLKGWSESRRKALKSDKIGKDAGDGMVWIVEGNSNGLTRVKPSDPRVAEQKRLKKFL